MRLPLLTIIGCLLLAGATAQGRGERVAATASQGRVRGAGTGPVDSSSRRRGADSEKRLVQERGADSEERLGQERGADSEDSSTRRQGAVPEERPVQEPRMQFEAQVHDFGEIARKGGDVAHDFVFRNKGDRPLVVLRAVTSCSCVKVSFPKRPVAPGQSGTIRIVYQPHKSEPGAFNKVIQIYSNAAGGCDVLTVQGHSVEPPRRVKKIRGA